MQMIYICLKSQVMTVTIMVQVFFIIFKNKNANINKNIDSFTRKIISPHFWIFNFSKKYFS